MILSSPTQIRKLGNKTVTYLFFLLKTDTYLIKAYRNDFPYSIAFP